MKKEPVIFVILVLVNTLPCFSGGPYVLEKGFHYMWSDADVYNEPDFISGIIGKVYFNTRVEILDCIENYQHDNNNDYNYWYKVNVNGSVGYIFGRYFCSERIEHTDRSGMKYIFLLYYATHNSLYSKISDDTIRIIIDGNEINFISPTSKNIERNSYFDYASIYNINGYAYEEWFFPDYNVFTLISDYIGHLRVFQYTFNNFGVESVRINWHWGDKAGEYNDSIILEWDNEKQVYYEIEETIKEQFIEEREEKKDTYETINRDNWNYSEIEDSGYLKEIKLSKTPFLDKAAGKIMSNKIFTYGLILFLLGIFLFCIFIQKRRKKGNI